MAAMEGEGRLGATAAAAIRLLLLTGCRKSEILSLRGEWVDIERGCLRLTDSKTGAKIVPLARAAVKLLSDLPRAGVYVLPAAKGEGHYTGLQKNWERVRAGAGLCDEPHDGVKEHHGGRIGGCRQQPARAGCGSCADSRSPRLGGREGVPRFLRRHRRAHLCQCAFLNFWEPWQI